tara:strand:- start:18069 stop:18833 length:765 start_codon:yes stop_codon:yes gene_type:complete
MAIHIGIPARYGSTRFPGKPLKNILGLSMIEHCYKRANLVKNIESVFIASGDKKISNFCEEKNLKYIETDSSIQRPGLRVQKAAESLNLKDNDIVVVWQGDEPLIHPDMVFNAIKPLLENPNKIFVSNMMAIADNQDRNNPSEIKVVLDNFNNAIFMSRAAIPSKYHQEEETLSFKQVCVMPFRWHFMKRFNYDLKPTKLEKQESIEMLRAIEHGYKVAMVLSKHQTKSVDTQDDLNDAIGLMENDKIKNVYLN